MKQKWAAQLKGLYHHGFSQKKKSNERFSCKSGCFSWKAKKLHVLPKRNGRKYHEVIYTNVLSIPWNASSISQDGGSWQMTRFSYRSPRLKMYSSWCAFTSPSLNPTKTHIPKKTEPILLMLQKSHEHQPPGMYRTPGEEVEMENLPHVSYRISLLYSNLWWRDFLEPSTASWTSKPWTQNNNEILGQLGEFGLEPHLRGGGLAYLDPKV